jgi:arylsulfatase A-like enzyme
LSNLGYSTNAISSHPFLHTEKSFNYRQGFDTYISLDNEDFIDNLAPKVTTRALQSVQQLKDRKFFLYMMYADPHTPYTQHPEFVFGPSKKDTLDRRWTTSLPTASQQMGEDRLERLLVSQMAGINGKGESRQRRLAKYNSEIAYTDKAIGDFLDGLRKLGQYDNSLIVFCGDHGEEFLDHGRYGHFYTLYHEVVDVPLIVKFPYQRVGKVIAGSFPLIDLFPSVLSMLHQDSQYLHLQGDGVNMPALLRCENKPIYGATVYTIRSVNWQNYTYYRGITIIPEEDDPIEGGLSIQISHPVNQLFDMKTDPGEYRNALTKIPDIATLLRRRCSNMMPYWISSLPFHLLRFLIQAMILNRHVSG